MPYDLTIRFLGLCIHFDRRENGELKLPHARRVLVPRFDGVTYWNKKNIPPHVPYLTFGGPEPAGLPPCMPPRDGGGYWLRGVTITVPDDISLMDGGSLPLDPLRCQPHLKHLWPYMQLDHDVVTKGKAPAAAYFDFDGGRLTTIPRDGSAASALTVQFATDVAHLQLACWDGGSYPIELKLPETITIENVGEKDDLLDDVVLNLFIATTPPPDDLPRLYETLEMARHCLRAPDPLDLGIGCSNSQFP